MARNRGSKERIAHVAPRSRESSGWEGCQSSEESAIFGCFVADSQKLVWKSYIIECEDSLSKSAFPDFWSCLSAVWAELGVIYSKFRLSLCVGHTEHSAGSGAHSTRTVFEMGCRSTISVQNQHPCSKSNFAASGIKHQETEAFRDSDSSSQKQEASDACHAK